MNKKELLDFRRERLRSELALRILSTIRSFKSVEEPKLKPTEQDIIHVLSAIIARRTE